MKNFNEISVIGGEKFLPGSKFDDFNQLIDRYYAMLFFTLTKSGITYSTGRNGILAKVKVEEKGFVNYVQPCIGKWNYNNPKYQRFVSPEFVLYLFNNYCMANCLCEINKLSEPVQINSTQQIIPDGIDLDEFSVNHIIQMYEQYANEYYKSQNEQPNYYSQIPQSNIAFVNLAYSLIERVTKFSKSYVEHQMKVIKADELRQDLKDGIISYDELTEEQTDLLHDDYYTGEYDYSNSNNYLSLGSFNNNIRNHAIKQIFVRQEKLRKLKKNAKDEDLSTMEVYNDPISISSDYYGKYEAEIDYKNAKEFDYGDDPKLERRNPTK